MLNCFWSDGLGPLVDFLSATDHEKRIVARVRLYGFLCCNCLLNWN